MKDFVFDLTSYEAARLAAVLDAMGDGYEPDAVLANEMSARRMLYSGLDESQQRIYDELVIAGVLPS